MVTWCGGIPTNMAHLYFSACLSNLLRNFGRLQNNLIAATGQKIRTVSVYGRSEAVAGNFGRRADRALYFRTASSGNFLLVSKMDALSDRTENKSLAKRPKMDPDVAGGGVLCYGDGFADISRAAAGAIGPIEDKSPASIPITKRTTAMDSLDTSRDSLELEPDDDNASTVSHFSELSGLSELSGEDWKPMAGSLVWIQKQMQSGVDPRALLSELGVDSDQIPQYVDDITLWKLIINMLAEPPRRHKLRHVNTIDDVVRLLKDAKNIIVLTGAGVSVSCGIPDFRSRDGVYLRLAIDFPDLPDPQAMFDINYFSQDPRPFYKFVKDIYPGNFRPSPCHKFIKMLEMQGKLLRNYTQNIDTLEKIANIEKVVECHGSFATATCTKCGHQVTADVIREPILAQKIPLCEKCHGKGSTSLSPEDFKDQREELSSLVMSGIMKPDIVFFGEGLPDVFHEAMAEDKNRCDLLLVIGSSLKVRPVALIPSSLPANVPQILINREPLPHCHFDVELLGDCDIIVNHLCQLLGDAWQESVVYTQEKLKETIHLLPIQENSTIDSCSQKLQENICDNKISTKLSSSITTEVENSCNCSLNADKQMSIISNEDIASSMELKSVKERHMSIDSARDSGIGENSNFTDAEKFDGSEETNDSDSDSKNTSKTTEQKPFWHVKPKKSVADRLPPNTFYSVPPSRYIFPGAEIFYDPNEKYTYFDDTSSSDSSESDSETENDGNNSCRD